MRPHVVFAIIAMHLGGVLAAGRTNQLVERSFTSTKDRQDPFNQLELSADFTAPDGTTYRVPAFWAGGRTWRVRYASPQAGEHRFVTACSDAGDAGLHEVSGTIKLKPYDGSNPLYLHGPLRVAADRKHFEHLDGTPFFWLGDTWWMGLTRRLHFPDEFQSLARDRVDKGFTVVQIVAGLYPDMPAFDERGANEAGFPWTKEYGRINPAYFDRADARIMHLVDTGIAPCIVGAWGYHLPWLGVERMKKHWRYLVARYGALPVFWCTAGEGAMPYYLSPDKAKDAAVQKKGWTDVARYLREIDPWRRPITIHPTDMARKQVEDPAVLDFEMLQTGHGDRGSIGPTIALVKASREAKPTMPTVNAEVCYEGILGTCPAGVQRFMAWSCLLSGTAGHTYGANGIWQVNRREQPYGPSPHGGNWGETPWDEAMILSGSRQTGLAKKLLERFEWHRFEPHPEWATIEPSSVTPPRWRSWIWYPQGNPPTTAPAETRWFRRTFELPADAKVKAAVLWVSADNRFVAHVNGVHVGSNSNWRQPQHYDVAALLKRAGNVIAIEAENEPAPLPANPAGLLCALEITFEGAVEPLAITSDDSWLASRQPREDGAWIAAKVVAPYGGAPWGKLPVEQDVLPVFAAGIAGSVRVIYIPQRSPVRVHALRSDEAYDAEVFDPVTGQTKPMGSIAGGKDGAWTCHPPTGVSDWVLVLRRTR